MRRRNHQTRTIMGALLVATMLSPGLSSAVCTAGFNSPSTNTTDTGGDGNGYESNPTRAYTVDGLFAVDNNSGNATGTACTSTGKDRHRFYNYGFSLPTGATIQGIELQLKAKVDSTTGAPKICAEFSWDGGTTWTTGSAGMLSTAALSKTNTVYTLGGPTNTWGRSWAPADFNNANLRVRLTDVASNNSRDFSLDYVGVKVSCTAPEVSFTSSVSQGSENFGQNLLYSDISVSLSTASAQTVTVNWAVESSSATTATNFQDYFIPPSGSTSGTVSFAPGEVRKTIRVLVTPDSNVAEGDETIKLNLSAPSSNATLGTNTSHTFTIYNIPARGIAGDFTADVVLGQRSYTESTTNTVVPNHVFNVGGVVVDRSPGSGTNGRAYAWDGGNNRILAFNLDTCYAAPGQACAPALVIGQPSGSDYGSCNQDGTMFRYPYLAPASASTLCGTAAWYISPKEGARRSSLAVDPATGALYVPDYENHRVLVFNNPFTDSTPTIADDVIGQDDFSGVYCNKNPYKRNGNYDGSIDPSTPISAPSTSSLCAMSDWYSQGFGAVLDASGNLWVADGGNNRVLRFSKDSATNKIKKSADLVLGQLNFTSRTGGTGLNKMQGPTSLAFGPDGKLYVADGSTQPQDGEVYPNSRVLVFTPDTNTGEFTSGMWGTLFSGGGRTDFKRPYVKAISTPVGLAGLWITTWVPSAYTPDLVLVPQHFQVEQFNWNGSWVRTLPMWTDQSGGFLSNNFEGSIDVDNAGNVLVPGGRDISDVVIYQASTNYSDKPATLLPPSFRYNTTSNSHLFMGNGIASAWNQLYVADENRIMIWNNLDQLTDGKAADSFIGPADFNSFDPNFNGNNPYWQMKIDSKFRLWVASRNRIFVYQTPVYTWSKPIKVIQGPFCVLKNNACDPTQPPIAILSDNGREFGLAPMVTAANEDFLWIAQPFNHRVFRIRNPLSTTPVVDMVLGQSDLTTVDPQTGLQICNRGAPAPTSNLSLLCYPYHLSMDQNRDLYVSDHMTEGLGNMRMLMFNTSDTSTFPTNNTNVIYGLSANKAFPSPQATYEAAFYTPPDNIPRMVVGYDSYGGLSPYVGIYQNPSSVTTPTCTLPSGETDCYLNDHTLMAGAATFDFLGNLYVADANHAKIFIYKQPFYVFSGSQAPAYPAMTQVISHVAASSDDAYTCGSYTATSESFTVVGHNTQCPGGSASAVAGVRFNGINIPSTATIDHAVIILKPTWINTYAEPLKVKINGVGYANPPTFSTAVPLTSLPLINDTAGQPVTVNLDDSENGPWKMEHWHATPNLNNIVQRAIAQSGWTSGNSMAFLISNDGTPNERSFVGYDYYPEDAPILYIQYH